MTISEFFNTELKNAKGSRVVVPKSSMNMDLIRDLNDRGFRVMEYTASEYMVEW